MVNNNLINNEHEHEHVYQDLYQLKNIHMAFEFKRVFFPPI